MHNKSVMLLKQQIYNSISDKRKRAAAIKMQLMRIRRYNLNKDKNMTQYRSIIPLKIYQTWHTKDLPPLMSQASNELRRRHPRFEYHLFDDNDCRQFIVDHFGGDVVDAFDRLIPGAYKADLWRYCVLYINGGMYLDIKYGVINGFRLIQLTHKEQWVLDSDRRGIYNAFIAVLPKNETLLRCIREVVNNVKTNYYGTNFLEPTGPLLVTKCLSNQQKERIELQHSVNPNTHNKVILYRNRAIMKMYDGYYSEQEQFKKADHYSILWSERKIYRS